MFTDDNRPAPERTIPDTDTVYELRTRLREASWASGRGTDLHGLRATNRLLILNYIREHDAAIRRADLARLTGLSRTAVGDIVEELLRSRLVREENLATGGDRRTIPLRFNATAGYILSCILGRNHLTLMLTDLTPTVLHRASVPFAPESGPELCLPQIVAEVRAFVAAAGIDWEWVVGVGVGVPAPVGLAHQGPIAPTYLGGWDGIDIHQILMEHLAVPVLLDSRPILGALGEQRFGAGREVADMLYVRIGSGIGGGLILDGNLYRGSGGTAGEIGHIPVARKGGRCVCGNRGCLETIASTTAIVAAARATDPLLTTLPAVIAAAQSGHVGARDALERAGDALGMALATFMNLFAPALIVLDGSAIRANHWLLTAVRQALEHHALRAPLEHVSIAIAALDGEASSLGGIALVLDGIFGLASGSAL